jgi:hypothetical protein
MSLAFISPSAGALSRSPMERQALAAGASFEQRDGWNVAVRFDGLEAERERARSTVGFADLSHLGKVELQGPQPRHLELGTATHADGMCWCPYTADRMLVLCDPTDLPALRERLVEHAVVVPDRAGHHEALGVERLGPQPHVEAVPLQTQPVQIEHMRPQPIAHDDMCGHRPAPG